MKKKLFALIAAVCAAFMLAAPALAEDIGITTPAEHDDIMGVLLDGAPYMSIDATQTVVKFQVPEKLRNVGPLQVYDYRHVFKTMINNVEDVTPDADGYVEIVLPSTGEFCVAKVPFTDVFRLTLDLRYLDQSMWNSAKTPDTEFDTDLYIIPPGEWRDSKTWREEQGLEPWPSVADEEPVEEPGEEPGEEPDDGESQTGVENPSQPAEEPSDDSASASEPVTLPNQEEEVKTEPQFPKVDQPFPWGSYVVVIVSAALGVFLVNLLRSK